MIFAYAYAHGIGVWRTDRQKPMERVVSKIDKVMEKLCPTSMSATGL